MLTHREYGTEHVCGHKKSNLNNNCVNRKYRETAGLCKVGLYPQQITVTVLSCIIAMGNPVFSLCYFRLRSWAPPSIEYGGHCTWIPDLPRPTTIPLRCMNIRYDDGRRSWILHRYPHLVNECICFGIKYSRTLRYISMFFRAIIRYSCGVSIDTHRSCNAHPSSFDTWTEVKGCGQQMTNIGLMGGNFQTTYLHQWCVHGLRSCVDYDNQEVCKWVAATRYRIKYTLRWWFPPEWWHRMNQFLCNSRQPFLGHFNDRILKVEWGCANGMLYLSNVRFCEDMSVPMQPAPARTTYSK